MYGTFGHQLGPYNTLKPKVARPEKSCLTEKNWFRTTKTHKLELGQGFNVTMDSSEGARTGIEELKLKKEEHVVAKYEPGQLPITCFSEIVNDATIHFQIIHFPKQIHVWVGYNSSKLGHVYAAARTRPSNNVSMTSLLGGTSDNTGSGLARRLVLKTGLNVILACNIPKNNPMLEAEAEKILVQKLNSLGYNKSRLEGTSV